jgi:hypothetical protein
MVKFKCKIEVTKNSGRSGGNERGGILIMHLDEIKS